MEITENDELLDGPQGNVREALRELISVIDMDYGMYEAILKLGQIGVWSHVAADAYLYTMSSWQQMFPTIKPELTFADYCRFIDSEKDQNRVFHARKELFQKPIGTKWRDYFCFCGTQIMSVAFRDTEGHILGFDMILASDHPCKMKIA